MSRILVLNDTRDQQNWGSQACAQALVDILGSRVPDAEIVTQPSAWLFRHHRQRPVWLGGGVYTAGKVGRFERRFTRPFGIVPWVVDEYEWMADKWLAGESGPGPTEFLRALDDVDAVVFNAEGCTYRTNLAAMSGLFMLWLARTRFGIPALFLNGTVAFTDVDPVLPGMARHAFPVLDGVAVREPRSARNVVRHVPAVEPAMIPDSVFAYHHDQFPTDIESVARLIESFGGEPYCVLSSSMLPVDFERSRSRSALVELVEELQRVVPNVVLAGKDRGDQKLEEVARLSGAEFFGERFSYADVAALLGSAEFLVSGRYHTVIFASIMGCPSVTLTTTSPKMEGLCELMDGLLGEPFDVTDLRSGTSGIVGRARGYLQKRAELRESLRAMAADHRKATAGLGDMVQVSLDARTTDGAAVAATRPTA